MKGKILSAFLLFCTGMLCAQVEVPEPEALPSVDDILKGIAKESLGSDAGAEKGKPNKGEA